jgi:hypothetical protein
LKDEAAVENLTNKPLKLQLYAADGYTSSSGAFSLEPNYAPKRKMGAWIQLPVSTVTIPPQTGYLVPFTYNVPANEAPGDYGGGIVAAETTGPISKRGHVHTHILDAIGVAVLGKVAGPLFPRLGVTAVTLHTTHPFVSQFGGPVNAAVTYSVTNTGNETLAPAVTISLSTPFGGGPKAHVQMPKILPGSTVTFHHVFTNVVPYVALSATVTAHALGVQGSGSTTAIIIPWALVIILVILIVLSYLYFRRRRRSRPEPQTGSAQPGNTSPGSGDASPERPAEPVETGTGARGP